MEGAGGRGGLREMREEQAGVAAPTEWVTPPASQSSLELRLGF